jgi:hypothetical protein
VSDAAPQGGIVDVYPLNVLRHILNSATSNERTITGYKKSRDEPIHTSPSLNGAYAWDQHLFVLAKNKRIFNHFREFNVYNIFHSKEITVGICRILKSL